MTRTLTKGIFLTAGLLLLIGTQPASAQRRGGGTVGYSIGYGASSHYGGYGYSGYSGVNYSQNLYTSQYNANSPYFGYNRVSGGESLSVVSSYSSRYYSSTSTLSLGYSFSGNTYGYSALYSPLYNGAAYYGTNPYYGGYSATNALPPAAAIGPQKDNTPIATASDPAGGEGVLGNWMSRQPSSPTKKELGTKLDTDKDIINGDAINALIDQLVDAERRGAKINADALDLSRVNFHSQQSPGQYGYLMLKDGSIPWGDAFAEASVAAKVLKNKIEAEFRDLSNRNRNRIPTQTEAKGARRDVAELSDLVSAQIRDMGLARYTEAKQAIRTVDSSLQFLADTPEYQEWKRGLKAADVPSTVKLFADGKLKVAPALPGTEDSYRAAYAVLKKALVYTAATTKVE